MTSLTELLMLVVEARNLLHCRTLNCSFRAMKLGSLAADWISRLLITRFSDLTLVPAAATDSIYHTHISHATIPPLSFSLSMKLQGDKWSSSAIRRAVVLTSA